MCLTLSHTFIAALTLLKLHVSGSVQAQAAALITQIQQIEAEYNHMVMPGA